jgi:hypothetical protein
VPAVPRRRAVRVLEARRARGRRGRAGAAVKAWFREFLLFPKQESKCGSSGYEPKSRYITSFYNDPDCKATNGFVSFDREFVSKFEASNAVVGGWKWTRDFDMASTRVVFGVPRRFSPLTAVWCLGYSQIEWISPSNFAATTVPVDKGVCTSLPAAGWVPPTRRTSTRSRTTRTRPPRRRRARRPTSRARRDVTLLGFQNENPRDFSKKEDSTLLTGPRRAFCTSELAGRRRPRRL